MWHQQSVTNTDFGPDDASLLLPSAHANPLAGGNLPAKPSGEARSVPEEYHPSVESVSSSAELSNFPLRFTQFLTKGEFIVLSATSTSEASSPYRDSETYRNRVIRELWEIGQPVSKSEFNGYSEKYLTATQKQLNADLEKVLAQFSSVKELIILFDHSRNKVQHNDEYHSFCTAVFLPIYKALRELGYSHRDLTE